MCIGAYIYFPKICQICNVHGLVILHINFHNFLDTFSHPPKLLTVRCTLKIGNSHPYKQWDRHRYM